MRMDFILRIRIFPIPMKPWIYPRLIRGSKRGELLHDRARQWYADNDPERFLGYSHCELLALQCMGNFIKIRSNISSVT